MAAHNSDDLADAAVGALVDVVGLTPKPGLTDRRGPGPGSGTTDPATARWAAKSLLPGLAAMAAAARRSEGAGPRLREDLGSIGRCTEWTARRAACGTDVHRGSVWALGLLTAAAALAPGAAAAEITAVAKSLAAARDRQAPRRPSRGSTASARYGAAGARGEARAGFPHVRRALEALRGARDAGVTEEHARVDALVTVMSTLQDTGPLYDAGPTGLRFVQGGARAVLEAGGSSTGAGSEALGALGAGLCERGLRPGGSEPLLAAALFLDRLC
ncbi:triphosphoribosyl-dephospho-CoA synthase [Streptomyces beijiangensis]|uniref:triphosphoribosyl-dephospho-CoA synthase n=1 Tax=Streptomyces beijiangensis TaxID=163361 RepID=A0A939F6F2_9ACTN|nr:triphosphoribosyl-dephospho-CoA synthase [Streptomyces beijiangensis]MBO0511857.1 triphosphoribosyl-dephospho-CoA synthase [Streptomyces beijiangensis]